MRTLRQITDAEGPLLLLDAASARIQVGFFAAGDLRGSWASEEAEAGVGVFASVARLGIDLERVGAFAFCEGPGSVLGIRTVAMALRAWGVVRPRPFYAYTSLAVAAEGRQPEDGAAVIADARRGFWHYCRPGGSLLRVPDAELAGPLVTPEGFRHWAPLPEGTGSTSYDLAELLPRVAGAALFRPVKEPDAYLPEEPRYAPWTPGIHRAP